MKMSKKRYATLFVGILLGLVSCGMLFLNTTAFSTNNRSDENDLLIDTCADYAYVMIPDLYNISDYVFVGEYDQNVESHVSSDSLISSTGRFIVKQVIKGDYHSDFMDGSCDGGSVPLRDYLLTMNDSELEKLGYSSVDLDGIATMSGESLPNFQTGNKYLLFIQKNEKGFLILSGTYGAREISDDMKLFDPDTNSFV